MRVHKEPPPVWWEENSPGSCYCFAVLRGGSMQSLIRFRKGEGKEGWACEMDGEKAEGKAFTREG